MDAQSLGSMLIAHAKKLSTESEPQRLAIQDRSIRRKAHRTDAKLRSSARKATRELVTVRRHIGEGTSDITAQTKIVLNLNQSGDCALVAEDMLAQFRSLQGFRKSHLVKLLTDQKNSLHDD